MPSRKAESEVADMKGFRLCVWEAYNQKPQNWVDEVTKMKRHGQIYHILEHGAFDDVTGKELDLDNVTKTRQEEASCLERQRKEVHKLPRSTEPQLNFQTHRCQMDPRRIKETRPREVSLSFGGEGMAPLRGAEDDRFWKQCVCQFCTAKMSETALSARAVTTTVMVERKTVYDICRRDLGDRPPNVTHLRCEHAPFKSVLSGIWRSDEAHTVMPQSLDAFDALPALSVHALRPRVGHASIRLSPQ